jgi:hypothetical protein
MKINKVKYRDRIRAQKEAEKILRNARKLSRELLNLESIAEIRCKIDRIEIFYRMAIQRIIGDNKLYESIREDAVYRFGIIADNVRERFGPKGLVEIAELYKTRYSPVF